MYIKKRKNIYHKPIKSNMGAILQQFQIKGVLRNMNLNVYKQNFFCIFAITTDNQLHEAGIV